VSHVIAPSICLAILAYGAILALSRIKYPGVTMPGERAGRVAGMNGGRSLKNRIVCLDL
jgi:hypothetical protein